MNDVTALRIRYGRIIVILFGLLCVGLGRFVVPALGVQGAVHQQVGVVLGQGLAEFGGAPETRFALGRLWLASVPGRRVAADTIWAMVEAYRRTVPAADWPACLLALGGTVVTDRRTYLFDLVASTGARPLYVLRFTYPDEPERELQMAGAQAPTAEEIAAATQPQAVTDPADLNFAWNGSGDRKLLPARTYDDGSATFLAWPAGNPGPAILIKDEAGTEGPVNFTVRGDVIVVEGVPREIVLRSGKQAATLTNSGPARIAPTATPVSPQAALARSDMPTSEGNR